MASLWSDKWADVPGQWSFIGLEWVLRSPDIQWMVVLHYTHRRRLVHRSATGCGSAALKFTQLQTQPSTFVMGVMRLARHRWQN
jgi:hypothetical protein